MSRLTSYNPIKGLLINEEERLFFSKGFIDKDEMYKITRHLAEKLAEYEDIGTVEECREARERQKPKKLTHEGTLLMSCTCPNCKNVLDEFETWGESRIRVKHNYCHFCGQKLNWSE